MAGIIDPTIAKAMATNVIQRGDVACNRMLKLSVFGFVGNIGQGMMAQHARFIAKKKPEWGAKKFGGE